MKECVVILLIDLLMQVLLLMATALDLPIQRQTSEAAVNALSSELRTRQQCIAEITEMIHVSDYLFLECCLHISPLHVSFLYITISYAKIMWRTIFCSFMVSYLLTVFDILSYFSNLVWIGQLNLHLVISM